MFFSKLFEIFEPTLFKAHIKYFEIKKGLMWNFQHLRLVIWVGIFAKGLALSAYKNMSNMEGNKKYNMGTFHCVKSVQIRSFFWSVFSCIRTEYRKIRTRNNSVFRHFSRSVRTRKSLMKHLRQEMLRKINTRNSSSFIHAAFHIKNCYLSLKNIFAVYLSSFKLCHFGLYKEWFACKQSNHIIKLKSNKLTEFMISFAK